MPSFLSTGTTIPQTESRYQKIIHEIPVGVRSLDPNTLTQLSLNATAASIYGRTIEEFAENSHLWLELIHPRDRDRILQVLSQQIDTQGVEIEYCLQGEAGQLRTVREKFWWVTDAQGIPLVIDSFLTLLTELTETVSPSPPVNSLEQPNSAENFQFSETIKSPFQKLVANVPGAIYQYILHPDGSNEFSYMSPGCREIFELEAAAIQQNSGLTWAMIHPDDLEAFSESSTLSRQTLSQWKWEWRIITPSGKIKWLLSVSQPEKKFNGDIIWNGFVQDITDRKEAEAALKISSERLEMALACGQNGLWDWNLVTGEVDLSSQWYEMLGYERGDLPEHISSWELLIHPDDAPAVLDGLNQHIENATSTYSVDHRLRSKSGEWKWILTTGQVVERDSAGKAMRMVGTNKDVSDRKLAEEEARRLAGKLQDAQRIAHIGSWEFEIATQKIQWSEELFSIFGLDPQQPEPTFEELQQIIHPDDRDTHQQKVLDAVTLGKAYEFDYRIFHPDGQLRYLYSKGEVEKNPQGEVVRLFGTAIDFTERKQAEQALQEQELFLRSMYDGVEYPIFVVDVLRNGDLRYAGWNLATTQTLGITSTQAQGLAPEDLFERVQATKIRQKYQDCLQAGTTLTYEECLTFQGRESWWMTTLSPVRDLENTIYRIIGVTTEITEVKRAAQQLREQQLFLRAIYDGVEQGIIVVDVSENGEIRYAGCNPSIERTMGLSSQTLLGKTPEEIFGPVAGKRMRENYLRCLQVGESVSYEETYDFGEKETWWQTTYNPLRSEAGRIYQIVATPVNITERKQAEQALAEREQFLRSIYEGVDYSIIVLDVLPAGDYRFADVNPAWLRQTWIEPEQILGKKISEFMPPEMARVWGERYQSCIEAGATICCEECYRDENEERWFLVSMTPLRGAEAEIKRLIITASDITPRKQAEEALRQKARQERLINRLAAQIRNSLNIDTILETAVQQIYSQLKVDSCTFCWYQPDTEPPSWHVVQEAKNQEVTSW